MVLDRTASTAQTLGSAANGGAAAVTDSESRYFDRGAATDTYLLQADDRATFVAAPAAITGGEVPTEAEFLALRTYAVALGQILIDVGIMKAS